MECLAAEFPCLRALAGEQVFELFAAGYIAARPSTDPSLYGLGAGFADYLEATRPAGDDGPAALSALPADFARLDRARAEVQRAVGVERLAGPAPAADLLLTAGRAVAAARQRAAADPGLRSRTGAGRRRRRADRSIRRRLARPRSPWPAAAGASPSMPCRPGAMPGWRRWARRGPTSTPPPPAPPRPAAARPAR
jgi:hypothetical protein